MFSFFPHCFGRGFVKIHKFQTIENYIACDFLHGIFFSLFLLFSTINLCIFFPACSQMPAESSKAQCLAGRKSDKKYQDDVFRRASYLKRIHKKFNMRLT